MGHSKHYFEGRQQRGIQPFLVELFKNYGSHFERPGGADGFLFDRKAVDNATKDVKKILQQISKLRGRMMIISADGDRVLTTYIREKRIRKPNWRKGHRRNSFWRRIQNVKLFHS